jgi:hypothetical protein
LGILLVLDFEIIEGILAGGEAGRKLYFLLRELFFRAAMGMELEGFGKSAF